MESDLNIPRPGVSSSTTLEPLDPGERIRSLEQEIQQLRSEVAFRDARLHAIQDIGLALGSSPAIDEVLNLIMDKITFIMDADRSTLFLVDEERGEIWSKVLQGERMKELRLKIGEGIAGWVAHSGKSVNIKDAYRDHRFNKNIDVETGFQTRSCLCQPIRNHERRIIGVVQVLNKHDGYFTVEDENLLSAIASQVAVSIENSKLYLSVVAKNIELLEYRDRLEQKMFELDLLYEIEREAAQAPSLDALLASIGQKCLEAIEAEVSAITLLRDEGAALYCVRLINDDYDYIITPVEDVDALPEVLATGRPYLCNDGCGIRNSMVSRAIVELGFKATSVIAVPLVAREQVIGCIEIVNRSGLGDDGGPARFNDGDLKLLTLIGSHISSAVAAQLFREQREKAQRLGAIGQMVSSVLHDLKTPISIISGYVQLMARQDKREVRDQYADSILKQFDTLNRMTKEILAFARGESTILIRKVFMNKFMDEAAEMLESELQRRGVELEVHADYRGPAHFDEVKLKRVFANLARNAAEAMKDGGKLTVHTFKDGDDLVFTFEDTGHGIPREIQPRLFESFVSRGKQHGTGLGLAIVKKIIDEHSGDIDFSTSEHGTRFTVRLPIDPGDPRARSGLGNED